MKRFVSLLTVTAVFLSAIAGLLAPVSAKAVAQSPTQTVAASSSSDTKSNATTEKTYNYVAQAGDSYSLMARKAIQTYGINNKVKLSQAKIIAAETWLTQEAGSPLLSIGEKVTIKDSTVKSWVDKAQKLSATEEAAWNVYAAGANFNTDAVGQSS